MFLPTGTADGHSVPTAPPANQPAIGPAVFDFSVREAIDAQKPTAAVNSPGKFIGPVAPLVVPPPVTFGVNDPEAGIEVHVLKNDGVWPLQIYRRSEFGYETDEELFAQYAATPALDPNAFGTRSGASESVFQDLQPGQQIIVLDEVRLDYLEQQREVLGGIVRTPTSPIEREARDEQSGVLADLVFLEVDHATVGQAVPDFDSVAVNIRARAPDDPVFQRAVDQAQLRLEAKWRSEGRTPDKLGAVIEAGEAGDLDKVRSLTKGQFVEMIGAEPDATPVMVQAEFLRLTAIYTTYLTGDEAYRQAMFEGIGEANRQITVDRAVNTVVDIAEAGGEGWADKSISTLHGLVASREYTPGQVLAIMSDPQIQKLMRQGLRDAESFDSPEQGNLPILADQEDVDRFRQINEIYSTVLYADGHPSVGTGEGRRLVDEIAGFIVDNTIVEDDMSFVGQSYGFVFQSSAADGHLALALAVGAEAEGVENTAFGGMNRPEVFASMGFSKFREKYEDLEKKTTENSRFLQIPVASVGGDKLPDAKRLEIINGLIEAFPEDVKKLNANLEELNAIFEQREAAQFAVDGYADVHDSGDFVVITRDLGKIPALDPVTASTSDRVPGNPTLDYTNWLWLARANRGMVDHLATTFIPKVGGSEPVQRFFKGASSVLFAFNAAALWNGPVEDLVFFAPHVASAGTHGGRALFGKNWSTHVFGATASGQPNTPFTWAANKYDARFNHINVGPGMKYTLVTLGKGMIRSPLDLAYLGGDGYNSIAYFTGNTEAGETDLVKGFAYASAFAGDAAAIVGAGLAGTGATLLGLSATAWTGIGFGLVLAGASANYLKGRYDAAHDFDAHHAKAWELLGIKDPEVARALGLGKTLLADGGAFQNAGSFLVSMFANAGYTPEQMTAFINQNWTAEQADHMATHIKTHTKQDDNGSYTELSFASVESYAEYVGIPMPDNYNASNSPFTESNPDRWADLPPYQPDVPGDLLPAPTSTG